MQNRTGSIASCTAAGGVLTAGAVWRGQQRSGAKGYDVEVRIAGVDEKGDVCGTLTIKHLLPTLPKVVTFFDGEIIGPHHDFITDKWGASEEDDHAHWDRFKRDIYLRGCPVAPSPSETDTESDSDDEIDTESDNDDDNATIKPRKHRSRSRSNKDGFSVPRNVVFMRLKERCFLNQDQERDLSEASFDGFYYIAVELNPAPDRPQLSMSKRTAGKSRSTSVAAPVTRSLLSASAPSSSTFVSASAACDRNAVAATPHSSLVRPTWGTVMTRMNSYASVVRGRTSGTATPPVNIPGAVDTSVANAQVINKLDEALLASQCGGPNDEPASYLPATDVFSPSLEEFPYPTSPLASSAPSFAAFRNRAASPDAGNTFRARSRSSSIRPLHSKQTQVSCSSNSVAHGTDGFGIDGANRLSTNFYNAKTGYRGAFAHATMRGFYFTPPAGSSDANDGDAATEDATSAYQELELFYVGDGMGALLEENEEEQGGIDAWGNVCPVDEMEKVKKDFIRREKYAQPQGSGSFSVM